MRLLGTVCVQYVATVVLLEQTVCLCFAISRDSQQSAVCAVLLQVGLPAKSGVSGVILLVVPNVFGMCLWSPPLDSCGNSVRGIQFCEVSSVRGIQFCEVSSVRASISVG